VATRTKVPRAAIAALAALLLAGCTSTIADPPDTSPTSAPSVCSAVATSWPSSNAPVTESPSGTASTAAGTTTPSMSTSPWPAELTPDQVAEAKAALAAYTAYWQLIDSAGMEPGGDWEAQIAEYASGPEKTTMLTTLAETAARGQRTTGQTLISPMVTSVQPAQITIADCVDKSQTDFLDSSGASIKAPNAPGSYIRHPANVQMAQLQDGRWQVVFVSDDWAKTC